MKHHSHLDSKRWKNSCLARAWKEKEKWYCSQFHAPLAVQAQCSWFIILLPISVKKLEPKQPKRCLEILDAAAYWAPKGLFIHEDFSWLNPIFSTLSRIIPHTIKICKLFPNSSWILDSKKKNHTLLLCKYSSTWLAGKMIKENKIASVPVTLMVTKHLSEIFCYPNTNR